MTSSWIQNTNRFRTIWFLMSNLLDLRHKARLVGGGNTTAAPKEDVYSGVIAMDTIRLAMQVAKMNSPSERANKRGVTKFCGHFRLLILGHC